MPKITALLSICDKPEMATKETIEQVVDSLIKKGTIPSNWDKYISFDSIQKRYDNAIKDRRAIKDMIDDEGFPLPMRISKQRDVWDKKEVEEWEENQKQKRANQDFLATNIKSSKDIKPSKRRSA